MASIEEIRRIWGDVLGIDPDGIGLDENFIDLGGDSVRMITLWNALHSRTGNVHNTNGRGYNGNKESSVSQASPSGTNTKLEIDYDDSAWKQVELVQDSVLSTAPVSPVQGFFLELGLAGYIGLINYIFEVEGSDLKHGLTTLVNLLESKNPIFRTVIAATKDGSFAQVLTAKSTSSWFFSSDLGTYLEKTMAQKFELAKPAVQYALVVGDPAHKGSSFFVISLHHTHCDAFSRFLISKEISQILESPSCYAQDGNPKRPWFGDYVKDVQLKATNDNATLFWNTYLRGANLPNIHPPDKATINGELDGAIIERIQASATPGIANSHSRNPTQIILAAWAMALAKLSGLRDITFGLCRHGRSSGSFMDVRRVMGPLVNALPFRVSLTSNEESVPELLQRIQTDITTTNKWEHGFSPSIFPSADGNPWVQSLVDLKSELHGMRNGLSAKDDQSAISKMTPRPDLDIYDMKSHWAVLLSIKQQKNAFQVSMYYQKPLLDDEKAGVLFNHFRDSIQALSTADDSVGKLLE
ncbi:hypothetical protein COCHEDRAFT_1033937 [Bipolaris maydis C5]|uniref:Carrier domain-containing protein n=1 Tax=Cochliobolus heterostrophus (strain C5 / ATCC 48332 / race O) TaxID=701091 RepID=M2UHR1_COCH5|nr:hypothetical protein COCHEDRAFT_1033937 [Bipolaris maydis C5]